MKKLRNLTLIDFRDNVSKHLEAEENINRIYMAFLKELKKTGYQKSAAFVRITSDKFLGIYYDCKKENNLYFLVYNTKKHTYSMTLKMEDVDSLLNENVLNRALYSIPGRMAHSVMAYDHIDIADRIVTEYDRDRKFSNEPRLENDKVKSKNEIIRTK